MVRRGHGIFKGARVLYDPVSAQGHFPPQRAREDEVRAEGLRDFLKSRVGALAEKFHHPQEPQHFRARDAENYVIARPQ